MPPKAQQKFAAIGQIRGRISWQSGQLPSIDVSGDVGSVSENIRIRAVKTTKVENIAGSFATFGPVQITGNTCWVRYSVSKLPLDTDVEVHIESPPDGGNFIFTGRSATAKFKLTDSVASGLDFVYLPA